MALLNTTQDNKFPSLSSLARMGGTDIAKSTPAFTGFASNNTRQPFSDFMGMKVGTTTLGDFGLNPAPAQPLAQTPAQQPVATEQPVVTEQEPREVSLPSGQKVKVDGQGNLLSPIQEEVAQTEKDTQAKQTVGFSASGLIPDLNNLNEGDLVNDYLSSAEGQLLIDRLNLKGMTEVGKAEALKQELETKFESDKLDLENKLASRGLFFSGMRSTAIKGLIDSLASSTLEVDRALASTLMSADLDLREGVLDGVADLVRAAKDGRKEAIDQLNDAGFAVIGDQLVPTVASLREQRAEEQQAFTQALSLANLDISQQRLALSQQTEARQVAEFEQKFGAGKTSEFEYLRSLMTLNSNATRAELKSAAMENTALGSTEIDAVLDTMPMTQIQMVSTAKSLVGSAFDPGLFKSNEKDLTEAKEDAKSLLDSTGGQLKVGGRIVILSQSDIDTLKAYIDTVTTEEAKSSKKLLLEE